MTSEGLKMPNSRTELRQITKRKCVNRHMRILCYVVYSLCKDEKLLKLFDGGRKRRSASGGVAGVAVEDEPYGQ